MPTAQEILPMPKRAYSYLRFSSRPQRLGDSHRRQSVRTEGDELDSGGMAALAAKICEEEGAVLDDTLKFEDKGRSAFRGKNATVGALSRFLDHVKRGRIAPGSILIFENIDRMSRDKLPRAMKLFLGILEAGIVIRTARPMRRYTIQSVSDLGGIIEPLVEMVRAHEESQRKSDLLCQMWSKKRMAARKGQAVGRRCPAWMELVGPDGRSVTRDRRTKEGDRYILISGRADTVRTIFRLAREGMGCQRITNWLRARPEDHSPFGHSESWNEVYVRTILRSRATVGEYQPRRREGDEARLVDDGDPIVGYYPVVVTEDEWQKAQAALDGRRKRGGRPGEKEINLFTGLVFHAETKKRLCVKSQVASRNGKRYAYLANYEDHGNSRCASGEGCRYDQFEEGVLEALERWETADVVPAGPGDIERERRIALLTERAETLRCRLETIQRQLDDPDLDPADDPDLRADKRKFRDSLLTTDRELQALKLKSQTGRGESLGQLKSYAQILREVRGQPGEQEVRLRFKAEFRSLVEEMWLRPQVVSRQRIILHVHIYLRGGLRKYVPILPKKARPGLAALAWQLGDADFRAGDVGRATGDTEAGAQLVG